MKVSELIEILKNEDPDRLVILQKDSEGNGYSPLSGVEPTAYRPYNSYSGETYLEHLTPEFKKQGYTQEDCAITGDEKALVLYPIN